MQTHLISIRVDEDPHEIYHYFCSNYNKLKEKPIFGVIFGNNCVGEYLNRDISKNQNFKYNILKIDKIEDIDYVQYMTQYFPFHPLNEKMSMSLYNTLFAILERKRWNVISKNI